MKRRHNLSDILLLTICAFIAGSDEWEDIETWGQRLHWPKKYGDFDNGVPVHDPIVRAISNIDREAFRSMFIDWMKSCYEIKDGEIIAIDEKQ